MMHQRDDQPCLVHLHAIVAAAHRHRALEVEQLPDDVDLVDLRGGRATGAVRDSARAPDSSFRTVSEFGRFKTRGEFEERRWTVKKRR